MKLVVRSLLVRAVNGVLALLPCALGHAQVAVTAGPPQTGEASALCAASVRDQATGQCLPAASVPTLGALYPISESWFVGPLGNVGVGTTTPAADLTIAGNCSSALTGVLTLSVGSVQVTGVGTAFTQELVVNDPLCLDGESFTVAAVINDGLLEVTQPAAADHPAAAGFTDGDLLSIRNANGFGRLVVDRLGSLGIGTTSPEAALHVRTQQGRIVLQDPAIADPVTSAPFVSFRTSDGTIIGSVGDPSPTGNVMDLTATTGQARLIAVAAQPVVLMTSAVERMRVDPAGNVGIGTMQPAQRLHVQGNICATGSIGSCSDARLKKDLARIEAPLDTVARLRGVRFAWRRGEHPERELSEEPQIGFVAQDVLDVLPEVVRLGNDGLYSVDYSRVTPLLVEAVKELKAKNEALERRLAEQEELGARVAALEQTLAALAKD
ncbi:MAG: tail fiber domain-containing protein [Planctomycetota bacterium]